MQFVKSIRQEILELIRESAPELAREKIQVERSESAEHGHYSTNAAFLLAKSLGKNPLKVAEELVSRIKNPASARGYGGHGRASAGRQELRIKRSGRFFEKVEAAPPGFINFWIANEILLGGLQEVLKMGESFGNSAKGRGKTVVVEYFQPNVAKILHVGHLRSAVIGDSIKRMLLSQGYKAVSDTHLGDWGTQFGILLHAYKGLGRDEQKKIKQDPFIYLNDLYAEENARIEADPTRREFGKEEFAKLERGDKENKEIWQWMVEVSMKYLDGMIERLGLLPFEEHQNESVYESAMPGIAALALKRAVAIKDEEGAVYADLEGRGLGRGILLKSDGASTYLLRDLATIQHRLRKWKFYRNLYLVDVRQAHHFRQLFAIAEILGWGEAAASVHISYGFMSLPEGKMSTRKGNVIPLEEVLDDVERRAREVIAEKNPGLEKRDEVARAIGLGAIKYFDLSHYREGNVVFDREKALAFEGNTGPYIQYTHARLRSILRKRNQELRIKNQGTELDKIEKELIVDILRLPEIVEDALAGYAPSVLANYVYCLSQKANEFYHSHPVLQEADAGKRALRLTLVEGVAIALKRGLYLLGIEAPEEM